MLRQVVTILGLCCLLCIAPSSQKALSIMDIKAMFDRLGDEFLTHSSLSGDASASPALDDDVPHPVRVNNWAHDLKTGQVAAVAVNPSDQPVIFHRGPIVWGPKTFKQDKTLSSQTKIDQDVIITLDTDNGHVVDAFGKNTFAMPHGLTIDDDGNIFVTDVGLHQVMRFKSGSKSPDLVLGKAFVPGHDNDHFCMPTAVAVASNGDFFVADGYCNSRIMKYNKSGKLIKVIRGEWKVPHSLALFEESDVLCVADREGWKVDCINAGLQKPRHANRDDTGKLVHSYTDVGRPYAIGSKGTALLVLSASPSKGITIDTAAADPNNAIIDNWATSDGITSPHDLAISQTGDAVYVAEVAPNSKSNKIHKYDVINAPDQALF